MATNTITTIAVGASGSTAKVAASAIFAPIALVTPIAVGLYRVTVYVTGANGLSTNYNLNWTDENGAQTLPIMAWYERTAQQGAGFAFSNVYIIHAAANTPIQITTSQPQSGLAYNIYWVVEQLASF